MRITGIRLKNFKRFTDLEIRDVPPSARVVVVVGPNGCGKSSLFDALLHWYRSRVGFGAHTDEGYYRKRPDEPFGWEETVSVTLDGTEGPKKGSLYVRTAYRHDPDFAISGINRPNAPSDSLRFNRVIDTDQAVAENFQRLIYDTMAGVYNVANDAKTVEVLRNELIGDVRASMTAVFGDLVLQNISDPLGAGTFFFEKGTAKSYHYKNLSGGEKAAFDLLLDLHVKKRFYTDAVYCIDELETHLHTRVQGTLIRELVKILPTASQLWVTTHSLGVLRAAQEMAAVDPGSVCVIDFDGVDPDTPRELVPSSLGRVAWEKMLSITLDDLSARVAPKFAIVCEGSSVGTRRKDFDAEIYNRVLGAHTAEVLFVSGGSSNQVASNTVSVRQALNAIAPSSKVFTLVDRDDKSPAEIQAWEATNGFVLPARNLESLLFADDVIAALLAREQKASLLPDALAIKTRALTDSAARGNAADDVKSAARDIYVGLKHLLGLVRCGDNTDAFMRDTLAPLVRPGMPTFAALKAGILDRLT